jgi:hypothetical protein
VLGFWFGRMEFKRNSGRNRIHERGELECFRTQFEFLGADGFHVSSYNSIRLWLFKVEVLIGFLAGAITFIIYYKDHLAKEKKLQNLVRILRESKEMLTDMDGRTEDRIWSKIDKLETKVSDLEVAVKVSLEGLKGKVAKNASFSASITTAITIIVLAAIKEFIFK